MGSINAIYLDGHATTPLAPEVFEAMQPWWHEQAGNPHSPHLRGLAAANAVEEARGRIAELVDATPGEIVFTSGATEANNLAVRGIAQAAMEQNLMRRQIVVSSIEHKSVLAAARSLVPLGFDILELAVDRDGVIDLEHAAAIIGDQTLLVSVMAVNNEIGSIQPVQELARIAHSRGALIHVDGAQAVGKLDFSVSDFDLASLSSHKAYGPMGIGGLYVAAGSLRPAPLFFGGSQERGIRPGTVPTPLVVGFGVAAELVRNNLALDVPHAARLSETFIHELSGRQVRFTENVPIAKRVSGSLSLQFPGNDAMSIIGRIGDKVSLSEGSACSSGQIVVSHVLSAIGLNAAEAASTLRLLFGRFNNERDALGAAEAIADVTTAV